MDRILLRTSDVVKHFTNKNLAAKALGISRQAIGQWKRYVPELTARKAVDAFPELAAMAVRGKPKRRPAATDAR
jgi:hypothetical protein